jgi:hypothetical protein
MLFEQILILILFISAIYFIGIPVYKIAKQLAPVKKDPLAEAKVRLEVAKQEIEAAKLNKEAEQIYSKLYEEVLVDDQESDRKKL